MLYTFREKIRLNSKYCLQSFERQRFELTWRWSLSYRLHSLRQIQVVAGLVFAKFHSNLTGVVSPEQILLVYIVSFFTRSAKTTLITLQETTDYLIFQRIVVYEISSAYICFTIVAILCIY